MSAAPHLRLVDHLVDENGEIQDCAHCAETRAECEVWERRVVKLEQDLKRALEDKDAKLLRDRYYPLAVGLLEEWRTETGHPNAKIDDPRRIRLALTVVKRYKDERHKLSYVIQQAKHLAWVDPDTGLKHDSFGKIFGSSDEIEKRATHYYLWARKRGIDLNVGAS